MNPSQDPWLATPNLARLTGQDIWWLRRGFLERTITITPQMRVIEVGSGPAHDSILFAQRGAEVTALDFSIQGLNLARQFYNSLKLPLKTVCGSATALPLADDQFDLAFNGGVLEHFTDEALATVIDEMSRVVRPGGTVLAFCPNRFNVFYQHHLKTTATHSYDFERAFTSGEMRCRFEAAGLRDVRISGVHVHPAFNYVLPSWLPKHHRIEPWGRATFGWLERSHGFERIKSLVGQDFVVWGRVPQSFHRKRRSTILGGGPAVRQDGRRAA
ncbi:MAG: class I SAM-dependent methyltransferase [Phycisphaeraceae bacterium]|nr:class I SAM-dependent methyltransferase [Phycisphaeraceae bacterium]